MNIPFAEALRRLRIERGLSQQQVSDALHVDRSTVAKWEAGDRQPDMATLSLLSSVLETDVAELLRASEQNNQKPVVILLDDEKIILQGGIPILEKALPGAEVTGFVSPAKALSYASSHPVSVAFLDIEMGRIKGLEVCRELLSINPRANVIFLTAYREYAFDAWATGACGFLLKPLTVAGVQEAMTRLRVPVRGLMDP